MSLNPGTKLGPTILGLTRLLCELASSLDLPLSPLGRFGVNKRGAVDNVVRRRVRGHGY